jgi:AcrR family transcriptional regulator
MLDSVSTSHRKINIPRLDTASSENSSVRILDAALALITKRGDARVTMAQIANAARISRQAVYLHFADRADLMVALARYADKKRGLAKEIQKIVEAPTGAAALAEMVAAQARSNPAIWAAARAVDAVRRTDEAAERSWQDRLRLRLEGCRRLIARLESEGNLRKDLDPATAADLLWTITSLRAWEDLVLERGWTPEQYQRHITRLLLATLTRTGATAGL